MVPATTMSSPDRPESANDPLRGHPASRLPSAADVAASAPPAAQIDAGADVGHVNLTVTDLEQSLAFYRDLIGLHVTQRDEQSAFLAAGGYHHHVALNTWDGDATAPPRHSAGLHHFALRLPDTRALAEVVVRGLRGGPEACGGTDPRVNPAATSRAAPPPAASPARSTCVTRAAAGASSWSTAGARSGPAPQTARSRCG